tara:strand:+ start:2182 stop:2550 length:369 start_codon:yes stop_codon:yes gene_type:complete
MSSLSVKLPLERDPSDGFQMNKSFKNMIKQNFKMLLLTAPGERVMEPDFGVGLKTYLFENFTESTFAQIERAIFRQVRIYMPSVVVEGIYFSSENENSNVLSLRIEYSVPNLNTKDLLEFTI